MVEGYLDSVGGGCVHGWARDAREPAPVTVTIYCQGRPAGSVIANIFRPDLKQAGIGDGNHGFAFPLPPGLTGDLTGSVNGTSLIGKLSAPSTLAEIGPHLRHVLAKNYLKGTGIEIGALDKPMWVPSGVTVRTVDRLPAEELRAHYGLPEACRVDYVCDAQKLETIPSGSQNFVIANHVFEHMENCLVALENWLRVLQPGGVVFMAIPDKRFTFDKDREVTPFAHVLDEYRDPGKTRASHEAHYLDWIHNVEHEPGDVPARLQFLLDIEYSIHYHCWTSQGLLELFTSAAFLGFELDCYKFNQPEGIYILKKL